MRLAIVGNRLLKSKWETLLAQAHPGAEIIHFDPGVRVGQTTGVGSLARIVAAARPTLAIVTDRDLLEAGFVNALQVFRIPCFGAIRDAMLVESGSRHWKSLIQEFKLPVAEPATFSSFEQAMSRCKQILSSGLTAVITAGSSRRLAGSAAGRNEAECEAAISRVQSLAPYATNAIKVLSSSSPWVYRIAFVAGPAGVAVVHSTELTAGASEVERGEAEGVRQVCESLILDNLVPALRRSLPAFSGSFEADILHAGGRPRLLHFGVNPDIILRIDNHTAQTAVRQLLRVMNVGDFASVDVATSFSLPPRPLVVDQNATDLAMAE